MAKLCTTHGDSKDISRLIYCSSLIKDFPEPLIMRDTDVLLNTLVQLPDNLKYPTAYSGRSL